MQGNVRIQRASRNDYKNIYELQRRAFVTEDVLYDYTIPPLLQTLQEAVDDCEKSLVLKAVTDEGVIVGSVRGAQKDGVCFINKLMVDTAYRGRGIGTALVLAAEKEFSPEQYQLYTGSKSMKNIALYERLGYRIVETDEENELVHMVKQNV